MISFSRFFIVMTSSFSLILFDNPTERGAIQLAFRTPTLTPTGVVRGCFSLFVIVRKPLKNLRFWLSLIQENSPNFSSSPVATTTNLASLLVRCFSYPIAILERMWPTWRNSSPARSSAKKCGRSWTARSARLGHSPPRPRRSKAKKFTTVRKALMPGRMTSAWAL